MVVPLLVHAVPTGHGTQCTPPRSLMLKYPASQTQLDSSTAAGRDVVECTGHRRHASGLLAPAVGLKNDGKQGEASVAP